MKIFLSYGHDTNAPLIEKIKDYLSKNAMLRIYPMSIEPCAEQPGDMKEICHFGEI